MANGQTAELLGVWEEKQSWGATWKMNLERYKSTKTERTLRYLICHEGGQSYLVGEYKSLKAALKDMASFSNYTKKVTA